MLKEFYYSFINLSYFLDVFRDRVVVHKTFHRYTVRAKQGGSQIARDGALGGMSGHKSAGSALRRHGEMAIRSVSCLSTEVVINSPTKSKAKDSRKEPEAL